MATTQNPDLAIPTGLTRKGRAVATAILAKMIELDRAYTGGCKLFESPKVWAERGEEWGRNSLLIVIHDGGDAAPFFNHDYMAYDSMEMMRKHLEPLGVYAEQCTSWYTAIYEA